MQNFINFYDIITNFFWDVGRSVGNSPGRPRSPVFDGTQSWARPRPWQDPESRGYWCVGRSVYSSGEKVRFTLPRWEPGEAWIRRAWLHAPPPRSMVNYFSYWSGDQLARQFCTCGLVELKAIRNGLVRWDTVVASSEYDGSVRLCLPQAVQT